MLELVALSQFLSRNEGVKEGWRGVGNGNGKLSTATLAVLVVLEIIFIIFAIMRALKCSQSTSDSRAIHFLFALTSPVLYIICSYAVPGFCT